MGDGNLTGWQVGCFRRELEYKRTTQPAVGTKGSEEKYLGVLKRHTG